MISVITTIFIADSYRKDCPSNSSGRRVGAGLTKSQAVKDCEPWVNQAPYFRETAREVLAVDGTSQGQEEVWLLFGNGDLLTDYKNRRDSEGNSNYTEQEAIPGCAALLKKRQWSEAIALAVKAGKITAPAHRPLKGSGPRQILRARVDPEALRRIELARKNKGQSLGDYLSEHGLTLPFSQ